MGSWMLNDIIIEKEIYNPAYILNEVDKRFKTINKYKRKNNTHDSMDLSVVVLDEDDNKLYFAGCNSSICLVNTDNPEEIKGNTLLAGIGYLPAGTSFVTHQRTIDNLSKIYMYTDGIRDQFGGDKNKKFGSRRFRKMLRATNNLSLKDQIEYVRQQVDKWRGNLSQTDDITLLAFSPVNCAKLPINSIEKSESEMNFNFNDDIAELTLKGPVAIDQFNLLVTNGIGKTWIGASELLLLDLKHVVGSDYRKIDIAFESFSGKRIGLKIKKIAVVIPLDLFSKATLIRISRPLVKYANFDLEFFDGKQNATDWLVD
jgi:hypothetical protein